MMRLTQRTAWMALFLGILALPACTDPAPDPGASRTQMQAEALRGRIMTTQVDR